MSVVAVADQVGAEHVTEATTCKMRKAANLAFGDHEGEGRVSGVHLGAVHVPLLVVEINDALLQPRQESIVRH